MINLENLTGSELLIGIIIVVIIIRLLIDGNFTIKNIIMSLLSISIVAFIINNPQVLDKTGEYFFKFILKILDLIERLELIKEVKINE